MINRETKYPGRFTPGTPQQPEGAFKNRTTNISKDGSYLEKDWLNDWAAFFSSITSEANVAANDVVDEVGASQIFDAMRKIQTQVTPEVFTAGQDWDGIAYIDPDAIGANPTAKIYPDGSIVGETDNGFYIKHANSTMEAFGIINFSVSNVVLINFPVQFIEQTHQMAINRTSSGTTNVLSTDPGSATQLQVFGSNSTSSTIAWEVKGVWK
jgi:hypothetical protein